MSDNPFRNKTTPDTKGKPTRYFSKNQEDDVASAVGGRRQPNSGATFYKKGDVVIKNVSKTGNDTLFLLECKTCTKHQKTFSIHEDWFDKNINESLQEHAKYSAIVFNFGPNEPNHYVIDETLFNTLVEYLKAEEDDCV